METVDPLVHTALLAKVHCNDSLVWFETSDFYYAIDTGPSLGFGYSVIALCHGDAAALVLQDWPLHMLQ